MSGGSFESSQRTEPVCATRFSSIKNCFKTQASGLARGGVVRAVEDVEFLLVFRVVFRACGQPAADNAGPTGGEKQAANEAEALAFLLCLWADVLDHLV